MLAPLSAFVSDRVLEMLWALAWLLVEEEQGMVQNMSDLEWPVSGRALGTWLERVLGMVWRQRAAVEVEGRTANEELRSAFLDQGQRKNRAGTVPSRGRWYRAKPGTLGRCRPCILSRVPLGATRWQACLLGMILCLALILRS